MSYNELVSNQRKFFRTRTTRSVEWRKEQLNKLKAAVLKYQNEIVEAVYQDLRRPKELTQHMEVHAPIGEIDNFLKHMDEWSMTIQVKDDKGVDKPSVVKEPKGVVLVMTAWNYPFAVGLLPLIAVIAAGNTAIIKPSEVSPKSASVWEKMISDTFDKNYMAVVLGGVQETTNLLKERFDHICYTGSEMVGKIVMAAAAKHVTPVTLELGGKCPGIVDTDVDIEKVAEKIVNIKFLNCGQICMTYDYLMTTPDVKPKLVQALKDCIIQRFGENAQKSPNYSRIVNKNHFDRIKSLVEKSSAKVLYKGGELDRDDVFIPPIILDANKEDCSMKAEIFGPVLPIMTVNKLEDAIEHIVDGEKPLSIYLFSNNQKSIQKVVEGTSSGAVGVNDAMKQVQIAGVPFGGVGQSGIGKYMGKWGFDEFSHHKAVIQCPL
uniref:Aldehyde dehydrogenase n=1 Tax=Ditylenchus dipsaci TaxID=166011 RepID=A0A915E5D0_9BILA